MHVVTTQIGSTWKDRDGSWNIGNWDLGGTSIRESLVAEFWEKSPFGELSSSPLFDCEAEFSNPQTDAVNKSSITWPTNEFDHQVNN